MPQTIGDRWDGREDRARLQVQCFYGERWGDPLWTVVVSRPGRSVAYGRSWGKVGERLDQGDYLDMTAWIETVLTDVVMLHGGVQQELQT